MPTTFKPLYAGAATAITISPASVASSATFVVGRSSAVIDNTSPLYSDVDVSGYWCTNGTTNVTVNTQCLIYVWKVLDVAPTYPDVITGSDATLTLSSAGVGSGFLKLGIPLNIDAVTQSQKYPFSFSVAQLFGGRMPEKWGLFVTQNSGQTANATGTNFLFEYTGYNIQGV